MEQNEYTKLLQGLDFGILVEQLGKTLTDTALRVENFGDGRTTGKINLELSLKKIEDTEGQLMIESKIISKMPKKKGDISETTVSKTPVYIGRKGNLSFSPIKEQTASLPDLSNDGIQVKQKEKENVTA